MRILVVMMLLFVAFAMADIARAWPHAQAGLVMYERTCPIHASTAHDPASHRPNLAAVRTTI